MSCLGLIHQPYLVTGLINSVNCICVTLRVREDSVVSSLWMMEKLSVGWRQIKSISPFCWPGLGRVRAITIPISLCMIHYHDTTPPAAKQPTRAQNPGGTLINLIFIIKLKANIKFVIVKLLDLRLWYWPFGFHIIFVNRRRTGY